MATKVMFTCDICQKDFETKKVKDGKEVPKGVGGLQGFYEKTIPDSEGVLRPVLMQYNIDLCDKCNKKIMDYYFSLGGK